MDSNDLLTSLDLVASSGVVLSTALRAVLQSSLVLLKNSEKFESVRFWGKISGARQDYLIAQGVGANPITDKKSFFSVDGVTWAQLPALHPILVNTCLKIAGRLTGNPAHEYNVQEPAGSTSLPAEVQSLRKEQRKEDGSLVAVTTVTEEKRLSALVATIDGDVAVAPRGAYSRSPTGKVELNPSFEGLSLADAKKLKSYFHLRTPLHQVKKTLAEQAALDKSVDFLDSLADDIPEGSWSVQLERGSSVVVLRSLLWPGLVAYHVPGTRKFGYVYSGAASKNLDLAFMLP